MIFKKNKKGGFTLIELLVVIAIIALLSSIVLVSLSNVKAKARDAQRKATLNQLKTALESYYAANGSYPLPYPPGNIAFGGVNTDQCATPLGNGEVDNVNGKAYIIGLTPTYIKTLPYDPPKGTCSGYIYKSDGSGYKVVLNITPESYPGAGETFYDPTRPMTAWMICGGNSTACGW